VANTVTPAVALVSSASIVMHYYLLQNDEPKGPYTLGQLQGMWNSGAITMETLHCQEGDQQWQPLRAIIHKLESPPPLPATTTAPPVLIPRHESLSKKSSRHNKVIGALMMCISLPGCMVTVATASGSGVGIFLIWGLLFFAGFFLFIIGRFQE
jgi:hypothetical protein